MCGVVGIYNSDEAAYDAMLSLFAIQNRGQESCGISVTDGQIIRNYNGMGLVKDVLQPKILSKMPGNIAIGHVRYPTRGSSTLENAQPHLLETWEGTIFSLASNGDIINYQELKEKLANKSINCLTTNDGEVLLRYLAWNHKVNNMTVTEAIKKVMQNVRGAFSTVLMGRNELWAFRDPYGIRPFSFGKTKTGYAFASETKSLDLMKATEIEDVKPGEVIHVFGDSQIERIQFDVEELRYGRQSPSHCIFEHVYFSMPDSNIFSRSVYQTRINMGRMLAKQDKDLDVDLVLPVPDSANMHALGYSKEKNIPFEMALIRNHYVGRTFIKPSQSVRDESVNQKFNPISSVIKGKKITVIDDSIVRGTTMRKIVNMLKSAGAKEIHLRIASPQVKYCCYYGLDTSTREELIANHMDLEELNRYLKSTTLKYISQEELSSAVNNSDNSFCFACFDGKYPVKTGNKY